MNHASHAVDQSAAVADGDGVGGAVAIDNYERPVSSVEIRWSKIRTRRV